MRENRTYGSEGGEGKTFPTPIRNPYPRTVIMDSGLAGFALDPE
jgi:hypothetical protein